MRGLDAHLHPPDPDPFCQICLLDEEDCLCPECPVCQSVGDPACYVEEDIPFYIATDKGSHGMILSAAQKLSRRRVEQQQQAEAEAEAQYFEELGSWLDEVESIPVRPACSSFAGKGGEG